MEMLPGHPVLANGGPRSSMGAVDRFDRLFTE